MTEDKIKTSEQQAWILIFMCWLLSIDALIGSLLMW